MAITKADRELVKELAELLGENDLTEIEWSEGERSIRVVQNPGGGPVHSVTVSADATSAMTPQPHPESAAAEDHSGAVKSPMVGTVYVAPEPGAPPFVNVEDEVRQGQTVLIVEAMKTMNPIPAPRPGVVRRILAADATPVEYGQLLMIIE